MGAASLLAPSASAQFGGEAGFKQAFMPDYLSRDINLFTEHLQLEEWQKPIVEVLLEDYQTSFRAGEADFRNRLVDISGKLQASGQQDAMKALLEPFTEWERQKAELAKSFEDNVKLQLGQDQADRWPILGRALRREKWLSDGVLSGESVDLILVSKQVEVPLDVLRSAQEAFVAYEVALDEALVARRNRAVAAQRDLRDAMSSGNATAGLAGMEAIMDSRIALRNMQDQQTVLLAAALGEAWGPRFLEASLKAAYPKAYRPRTFLQVFQQVLAIETLTEQQRTDIQAVQDWYTAQMDELEGNLQRILREEEPAKELAPVQASLARARGEDVNKPSDTFRTAAARRETLQEEAADKLRFILTPEQLELVPGLLKHNPAGKTDERSNGKVPNRFGEADADAMRQPALGSDGRAARAGSRGNARGAGRGAGSGGAQGDPNGQGGDRARQDPGRPGSAPPTIE